MKNPTGYVHSVESAGTLDGPGVRWVLFLQGCPLSCLYCHNPDAKAFCQGRQTDAFTELRAIAQNRDFLLKAGGGVTVSGGEPLAQPAFVKAIFEGCRMMGLHTALDTSGYLGRKADEELLALTDLVLLDIKFFREEGYRKLTGVSLAPTLEFARRLADMGKPVWLRYVLVPGLTDDLDAIADLADFVRSLGNVERVEVLPFHKMGEYKWKELGKTYELATTPEPTASDVMRTKETFERTGLLVF